VFFVLFWGLDPHLGHKTDKCGTYPKCESGLNYITCAVRVVFRPTSVEHTQNVSESGLNYHLCCILCSGPQVWDITKMWGQTWLAPCPYAPYSMNILTLVCCPKAEKFLSVFGRHLKPEGLLWCRGKHLFLFKKENYCI